MTGYLHIGAIGNTSQPAGFKMKENGVKLRDIRVACSKKTDFLCLICTFGAQCG